MKKSPFAKHHIVGILNEAESDVPAKDVCRKHDIKHCTTTVRTPRTNGDAKLMDRTLLNNHFRIKDFEEWGELAEPNPSRT